MAKSSARTHVLLTLGALFTIGGATRILPHALAAAEGNSAVEASTTAAHSDVKPAAYELEASPAEEKVCFTGAAASALASDQKSLKERAAALQEQELALRTREQELTNQAAELQVLQQTIDDRWKNMTTSANQDIQHLAQMYSAMKPDQAAGIFNQMDPGFAAGFLRLMPSDQAGLILAGMQADKAYIVSVKLASKNGDIRSAAPPQ